MTKISVIIPVLNEANNLKKILTKLQNYQHTYPLEIIVIDGNSSDKTLEIAQQIPGIVAISSNPGRANQMNSGANLSTGNILLFLHADTQLPNNYCSLIIDTLSQPDVIAGAFKLKIDSQEKSLRFIETMVQMRSRFLSLPYGDQALFLTKETFNKLGGFSDLPIMEDFEFVRRLKSHGKIAIAPAAVITSSRRWDKLGVWKTTIVNQLVILGYYLGISPTKLRNFYRNFK